MVSEWRAKRASIELVATGTLSIQTVVSGLLPADKLDDGDYPALMVGAFLETSTELPWEQVETTTNVAVLYWNLTTQEQISAEGDALLNAINAASGTGTVADRTSGEIPERDLRVIRFEVEDTVVV